MLANSERVRNELAAAVDKLDTYIDLLKAELAQRDGRPLDEGSAHDPHPA